MHPRGFSAPLGCRALLEVPRLASYLAVLPEPELSCIQIERSTYCGRVIRSVHGSSIEQSLPRLRPPADALLLDSLPFGLTRVEPISGFENRHHREKERNLPSRFEADAD